MASQDVTDQDFEAQSRRSEYATPIERGPWDVPKTGVDESFPGISSTQNDSDTLPSLRIDPRSEHSWDSSRTPSRALSSRNPFRKLSPLHLSGDFTSEASTSPLHSPLSASQIQLEELETEQMELELRLKKINLRKKKLQFEQFENQERQRLEAERLAKERHESERLETERQEQIRIESERIERERLEAERQEQLKAEAERAERERLETERAEQLRLEAEKEKREQAERHKRQLEEEERARLESERKEKERIEAERLEALKLEQERIAAEARAQERHEAEMRKIEAQRLERQKSARIALEKRQQMERDRLEEELHREASNSTLQVPSNVNLDAGPPAGVGSVPWNENVLEDRASSVSPLSTHDAPPKSDHAHEEELENFALMEQRGKAAKHRRSLSFNSLQGGEENFNKQSHRSSTDALVEDGGALRVSRTLSTTGSASNSPSVSRHTSWTSPTNSMLSSQTDEELAWEMAAEGALNPGNLNELHPLLQQQLRAAMERHMPQDEISVTPDTSRALSVSDVPSKRPPVPPKPTNLSPIPATLEDASPSIAPNPPADGKTSESFPPVAKTNVIPSPRPGPFRSRRPSSVQSPFRGFDSEIGTEPVDEDRCDCGKARPSVEECYFCWPCDGTIFCKECWDACPPHRKKRLRGMPKSTGLPHEKTDPAVAKKIFQTLQSDRNNEEQALLHVQDEDTSWFGAGRDEEDDVVFQDFGRYARLMAEKSARSRRVRYPSLVSFVGQTGAGKSSLIRLLIELFAPDGVKTQVPVVGSNLHQDVPTSGDVHLYADPKTFEGDTPILYADCEGLDGGARDPMGARTRNKKEGNDKRTHSFVKHIRKQHHTSERDILWAKTDKTRSREYHVRHLYPRLLYTFSDVIVFVMKNPKVIENAIEQLIRWAEAALETSSNQPVLPHAVIVLNASDNASDPMLWDVNNATINLMDSVRRAVHQNHEMRKFAETWRQRGRTVETVEMLLLSYYSSVRVVRVPEKGRPNLINEQLQKLYLEIEETCVRSRDSKHNVRMLLNSDELQPYLQYAFDHFTRDLETPFDFVQASFSNNPIPANFGGNILKLAINIMDVWKDALDGPSIFRELSFMVASCIMLDSARHRTLGPAEKVFPGYIEYCDTALDEFCNRHWPCEYAHPNNSGRCVNVKAGHQSKGHQLASGKVLAVGEYESVFNTDNYQEFFRYGVYFNLQKLLEKLRAATTASLHLELQKAAEIHRDFVLKSFYQHLSGSKRFISHTSCFSCLIAPPEHALPCGHVLCTPCIQAFGKASGRYMVHMSYCPLHHEESDGQFQPKWPVTIKPASAGVRILSLDGGGVRGISELIILQEIERALGGSLPIQAFFDLIVGTSTGGIVALGLGANGWSVQRCISHFESLCRKAFTRKGPGFMRGMEFLSANWVRYETKPMEEILRKVFGEHNLFAGSRVDLDDSRVTQRLTKVAVTTTTTAGTAAVLANYNRLDAEDEPPYQFHRSEKPSAEIKTWQAARATSAAPTMFKAFAHDPSGQVYQDGALWYNCPIEVAMRERRLVWPDVADNPPDVVLSIGTGWNPNSSRKRIGAKISKLALFSQAKNLAKVAIDHVEVSLNSEQTWRTFIQRTSPPENVQGRFVRFNLKLDKDPPKMDEVRALEELKEKTMSQFTIRRRDVKNLADRLIATSFFFVQDEQVASEVHDDESMTIAGFIMCRFASGSEELRGLGDALRSRLKAAYGGDYTRHNPYFKIQERGRQHKATQVILEADKVDLMKDNGIFSLGRTNVHLSNKRAETEILFSLGDQSSQPVFYPISGMPRCLVEDSTRGNRAKGPTTPGHKKNSTFDADMAAFEAKKAVWRFSSDDLSKGKDPFELYGSPGYKTPGNVPSDTISKISQRYSTIARSASSASMAFSSSTMPMVPVIPGKYLTPDDIGKNMGTPGSQPLSEDAEGSLSEALLDPESENVRQQMLYLLYASKGRPPPPQRPPPPPPIRNSAASDDPPMYIPTIGFENRATRQRNIQEFVSASDQYRLGFSARTKHLPGVFELDSKPISRKERPAAAPEKPKPKPPKR